MVEFYSTRNLLDYGQGPDLNRRFVHKQNDKRDWIATFNPANPDIGWSAKDQKALNAYLIVLNSPTALNESQVNG